MVFIRSEGTSPSTRRRCSHISNRQAHLAYEVVKLKPGFDVDDFIAFGAFGFWTGLPIKLRARFQRPVAEHVFETPLAPKQRPESEEDGSVLVSATVAATRTLVYYVRLAPNPCPPCPKAFVADLHK